MQNNYLRIFFVFSFVTFLSCHFLVAQTTPPPKKPVNTLKNIDEEDLLEDARDKYYAKDLDGAKKYYEELLRRDSTNVNYNYEMGLCFYETPEQRLKALFYFERVERHLGTDILPELYYYLGKTYHLNNQFDLAITALRKYLKEFQTETDFISKVDYEGLQIIQEVESEIEACKKAKETILRPKNKIEINGKVKEYEISSLGSNVNSIYDDYGTVLSQDDTVLYFTSRRKPDTKKVKIDEEDEKYYEDIYVSKMREDGWSVAMPVGDEINSAGHDAVNYVSPNADRMYVYRSVGAGKFYESKSQNGKWISPKLLENAESIMAGDWNTSLFMTADEKTILFVSDRAGTFGNRDIYIATKSADGKWGKAKNLSSEINSPFDEECPFLSADGKTLFFSSRGHLSIGGFDIYRSNLVNGEWTEPINMGFPINTAGDDLYFMINNDGDYAYYSSTRANSEEDKGDMDIYSISLCDEIPQTTVKGYVISKDVVIDMSVMVIDKNTGKRIARSIIGADGKYSLSLLRNRPYLLKFEGKNVVHFETEMLLPKQCRVYDFFQQVNIARVIDLEKSQWMQEVTVKNAFFDIRKKVIVGKFKKNDDETINYSAFIDQIDAARSRFNINQQVARVCISDIVDLAKLRLTFSDSSNNVVETAVYRGGVFVFNELKPGAVGSFSLAGADPNTKYVPLLKYGMDTIALMAEGNSYVWPKQQMIFTSKGAAKTETTLLSKGNVFNFKNTTVADQGSFKMMNVDSAVIYRINYVSDGVVMASKQHQDGVTFPYLTLSFYNATNELVETSLLNKQNEFVFSKVSEAANGTFRYTDQTVRDVNRYTINIVNGGVTVRLLKYEDGVVLPYHILGCFATDGTFIENVDIAKNRTFKPSKVADKDQALYFLKGDHVDTVYKIFIDFDNGPVLAVRSEDEFLRSDRMKSEEVSLLLLKDSLKIVADKDSYDKLVEQALAALSQKNAETYQQQLAIKKNETPDIIDDSPDQSFPHKKLHCFDVNGQLLASARLTQSGKFMFEPMPDIVPFVLFKTEAVEQQELNGYRIYIKEDSLSYTKYAFADLKYEDGYYFMPKTMNFYDNNGTLLETAMINKNGIFVFRTLNPEEPGLFKLSEKDPGLMAYGIDIARNNVTIKQLQYESGVLYPRRSLVAYNSNGDVLQRVIMNKESYFVFKRLSLDENVLYKIDPLDAEGLAMVQILADGKTIQAVRTENEQFVSTDKLDDIKLSYLEGADSLAFIRTQKNFASINKTDTAAQNNALQEMIVLLKKNHETEVMVIREEKALAGKSMSIYTPDGLLIETAKLTRKGTFTFTKIPPDEFVVYKIQGTDPNPNYTINFASANGTPKSIKLGNMQNDGGYMYEDVKMNYYSPDGKLIETASVNSQGKFIFKSLNIEQNGIFKIEGKDPGLVVYAIEVVKSNKSQQKYYYQQGAVYQQQTLVFYNAKGEMVEKSINRKDGSFVFKNLSLFEDGRFVIEGDSTPDNVNLKIVAGDVTTQVLRNKDGYVSANSINKIKLNALPQQDITKFNALKAELTSLGNSEEERKNEVLTQIGSFIAKNDTMRVMYAYNKQGQLVDKAILTPQGTFDFKNLPMDEFVVYKMDGVDRGVNYTVNIKSISGTQSLKTSELKREGDVMYVPQTLVYYNRSGKPIETATINKNGEFVFRKIDSENNGYYQMQSSDPGLVTYTVKVVQPNKKAAKTMQYQAGNVYETQTLSFYNAKGELLEKVIGKKDGTFAFSNISIYESGYFNLDGTADSAYKLTILVNGKPVQVLRSDVGYVKTTQASTIQLTNLVGDDSVRYAAVKARLIQASIDQDTVQYQQSLNELTALAAKNNEIRIEQREYAGKKLYAYSGDGKLLETATLSKGGYFVFQTLTADQFVYFQSEGVSGDNTYLVRMKRPGVTDETYALKQIKVEENIYYPKREMVYYVDGKPADKAVINKEGKFVFTKLSSYETGMFKMEGDDPGLVAYVIQVKKADPIQYQGGVIFPMQTLLVYDADGKLVEKTVNRKDGSFVVKNADLSKHKMVLQGKGSDNVREVIVVSQGQSVAFVKNKNEMVPASDIVTIKLANLSQEDAEQYMALKQKLGSIDKNDPTYNKLVKEVSVLIARNDSIIAKPPVKEVAIATVKEKDNYVPKEYKSAPVDVIASSVQPGEYPNILFDYDKAIVRDEYKMSLDELAIFMKENKTSKVEISGHTDAKGNHDYNLHLSRRRVASVAAYLVSKGVSNGRIIKKQFGKTKPIAPNENPDGSDNPSGRAQNRRVELKVIVK